MKIISKAVLMTLAALTATSAFVTPALAGEGALRASSVPFTNDNPVFMYVGVAGVVVIVLGIILFILQRKNK